MSGAFLPHRKRARRPARRGASSLACLLALFAGCFVAAALAQLLPPGGVEVSTLEAHRGEQGLTLDFAAKVWPNRTVEDALQRGIAVYFVAEAELYRPRWYWRDDRVARLKRTWRVSYQPLTSSWKVGSGGLSQTVASQAEALALASRITGWKLAETAQIAADERYYVEFSYKLDTSQLPRPMQLGLGGLTEWSLEYERTLRVD